MQIIDAFNVSQAVGVRPSVGVKAHANKVTDPSLPGGDREFFFELAEPAPPAVSLSRFPHKCDTDGLRRDLHFSPNIYHFGLGVGLVSLSAFFIGLILAYSFRIEAQQSWQQFQAPTFLWLSTVLLGISSWLLEGARYSLRRGLVAIYRGRVAAAIGLGLLFVALQISAGVNLIQQGVAAAANPHGSAFYLFMGIHGAHILGGIGWLSYLYFTSAALLQGTENELRKHRLIAGAATTYWHFMGVVWGVLFYFLVQWTR